VALEAYRERRNKGGKRALIVAPLSLMKTTWRNDVEEFTPELTISYAFAGKRKEAFEQKTDIVMINTDGVRWITDTPYAIRLLNDFDTVIIDEMTYYKKRTAARSKAMKKIASRFKYRVALSGTPRTGSVLDMWHQILILDDGHMLGPSFTRFRQQFCIPRHNGFAIEWADRPDANKLLMHLIGGMMIRYRFDEVMDVPPNYTRTIKVNLPANLRQKYVDLEVESVLELKSGTVSAVNAAVMANKLLQLTSGSVYDEHGEPQILDTTRYELITDLVAERDHTVVFFNWRHQRDELIKLAKKRGISYAYMDGTVSHTKREKIVAQFQAGNFQALYLQPDTGAHGLTLTRGRTTIWSSPVYKPDVLKQGLHRIYRGGQKHKTETILIEAEDTIEQHVFDKLRAKEGGMLNLLSLIEKTQDLRNKRV
jgi:SNF2 family DNA or RNA helicase